MSSVGSIILDDITHFSLGFLEYGLDRHCCFDDQLGSLVSIDLTVGHVDVAFALGCAETNVKQIAVFSSCADVSSRRLPALSNLLRECITPRLGCQALWWFK